MKLKRWMLIPVAAAIFTLFGFSQALAAPGDMLTLNGDILDVIGEIEYGSETYRFDDSILAGADPRAEVYLVADVEYEFKGLAATTVTFDNFRLEGANAGDYIMPEIMGPLEKETQIVQKAIRVSPAKTWLYRGQSVTEDEINVISDYTEQIVPGDQVNLTAALGIQSQGIVDGSYEVTADGAVNCDNGNYRAVFDNPIRLELRAYYPGTAAETSIKERNGIRYAELTAPEGYLISRGNESADSAWSDSVEAELGDSLSGSVNYYLRNNDPAQTESYRAISEEMTYSYTLAQVMPEIRSITIEKTDENDTLNFWNTGVYGNGSVRITVEAVGAAFEQETKIYLGGDGSYEVQDGVSTLGNDGNYYYTAVFTYDAPLSINLGAYAENSSGTGSTFTQLTGISDLDGEWKTTDIGFLVLDNEEPEVTILSLDGNYQRGIMAEVKIEDLASGIAKIEYLWDTEFRLEGGIVTDYTEFAGYTEGRTQYMFYLPWEDAAEISDGRHTLKLRVTDRAGNICEIQQTDPIGSDMHPPEIKKVEIRESTDAVFRFLYSSYYSNKDVEIAVSAKDQGTGYQSGIDRVVLNGCELQKNAAGEYVLAVAPDTEMGAMKVTVTDKAGWDADRKITYDSAETGLVENVGLIVENCAPTVEFAFQAEGGRDAQGRLWFGAGSDSTALSVTAADKSGAVNSGLYSLKIADNGSTVYETEFTEITLENVKNLSMSDFEEGEHILTAVVEDNAGNTYTAGPYTFFVDRSVPVSGGILIDNPESKSIDGKQWFEGQDIITFRIYALDRASGLKTAELELNGQSFLYEEADFLTDDIGNYVVVNTENIASDAEKRYTVTAKVTDVAGNIFEAAPVVVHVDKENPQIERVTVERAGGSADSGLNVLSHGVYANDTLICKVYAADEEFGSGMDYVTYYYEGMDCPEKMTAGNDGAFCVEISAGEDVFEKEITIAAYDKFGKESGSCPLFTNGEEGEENGAQARQLIMLEKNEPVMSLKLPEGDGADREDGQIWYQSNKAIEFTAQDTDSGIYHISFTVNGIEITSDKNGTALLRSDVTRLADERITEEQSYLFDTDYLMEQAGEASDGKYLINIRITDNAGNTTKYATVFYIDKTAPQIDSMSFSVPASDGVTNTSEFVEQLVYGYYFRTDFKFTVSVSDSRPSAGLKEISYRLVPYVNGLKQEEITGVQAITDGKAEIAVPGGFKGQIFVEAVDNVGNRSGEKTARGCVVDNTVPEIVITGNVPTNFRDAEGNRLYTVDNSITVEITDLVSGIREIGYAKSAEADAYGRKVISVGNGGCRVGDDLGDGWIVAGVDANLVTRVTRTFVFSEDDNNVVLSVDAMDNSGNRHGGAASEKFTIDRTNPVINVAFREDVDDDLYYSQSRIADITVIERNFSADCINILIENTFGQVPGLSFIEKSTTEHTAVIEFDEGDYTFDVAGTDLGSLPAIVNFSGGNEKNFFVDKTQPGVEENFASFTEASTDNSFNSDRTVTINVEEHNFAPNLTNLRVFRKAAGTEHNAAGMVDVTAGILNGIGWENIGDSHTLSFTISEDAVYRVELAPLDLAGNAAESHATAVFEIDKTAPVVTAKNGMAVSGDAVEFLDIYPYSRKDEPAPAVEFEDLNLDHINYSLTVYIPEYSETGTETVIRPVSVYLEEDTEQSGQIRGGKFVLPDFTRDGVYALELSAVDVAGNESLLNVNTYARMVEQDVLAYILDSNPEQKTGLYSFQYENGDAISKRPDNFSDIKIFALAQKDTDVKIVLRDNNGEEYIANASAVTDDSVYGMTIYYFTLEAAYFKENFQEDTDAELRLSVMNEGSRIDLGKLHIDNIAPDCEIPEEFRSWKWFAGEENRTITISNISELLDESRCRVYDNGQEIAFRYDGESNTLEFTLAKGWHSVGILLSDTAGNVYNIQERTNIHIGNFWSWIIGAGAAVTVGGLTGTAIHIGRKRAAENRE